MSKRKTRVNRRNRRLSKQRPGRMPKKMGVCGHGTAMTISHDAGAAFPATPTALREMLLRRVQR